MLNAEGFQKQTHVNCRVRKVHWSGHFGPSQANVEIKQTSPEGHVFYFNEKKHVIFVGPVLKVMWIPIYNYSYRKFIYVSSSKPRRQNALFPAITHSSTA